MSVLGEVGADARHPPDGPELEAAEALATAESLDASISRAMTALRSSERGLGSREAERRRTVYGPNVLPARQRRRWLPQLVRQFSHPLALLLWLASVLAFLTAPPVLGWSILGVIVVNAIVAFLQEQQAARAVDALAGYLPPQARAVRDGAVVGLPAAELVPGDVLVLAEGDRVSADARLLSGSVAVDASALTGESVPVRRIAGATGVPARIFDAEDRVFSGTVCTAGAARALVVATGTHTELGRIAALSQHRRRGGESPLEREVRRSTWLIAGVAVAVGTLFLPLGMAAGLSLPNAAVFAVGLLVANVPEGLLPTITLALAIGVRVLARRGALVKRLSAVETLGSTTVICTDKTGTLTVNAMHVVAAWTGGAALDPGHDPLPAALLEVLADCETVDTTDPMERALRASAAERGVQPREPSVVHAFDPRRKRMSVVVADGARFLVEAKGAPETVLPVCTGRLVASAVLPLGPADRAAVDAQVAAFAARGLRVLALARRDVGEVPEDPERAERGLALVGLVALLDPPRPAVAAAVAACHTAGIRVHVITGDNGATAAEIARQVGIGADRVVQGEDADRMSEPEIDALLKAEGEIVFARSSPEGKLRIAEALRANGEVVAMTGDGVNDAPALHAADIGVAMGRSGTDVAREAATMVLTDDDFATIVTAVREGRRVYDNLRKFVLYIFVHLVPEVVPFVLFALSGGLVPLPLTVLQILAIDLGTEIVPALALAREQAEPDVMTRPPRRRRERLISGRLLLRAWVVMGPLSAALALGMFLLVLLAGGWTPGAPTGPGAPLHLLYLHATTATFATIVACQVGTAFAARTERASLAAVGLLTNRTLLAGVATEVGFVALLAYVPSLAAAFGTAPLPGWVLLLLLPCPVIVWAADEAFRWFGRRTEKRRTSGRSSSAGAAGSGYSRSGIPASGRGGRATWPPTRSRSPTAREWSSTDGSAT